MRTFVGHVFPATSCLNNIITLITLFCYSLIINQSTLLDHLSLSLSRSSSNSRLSTLSALLDDEDVLLMNRKPAAAAPSDPVEEYEIKVKS